MIFHFTVSSLDVIDPMTCNKACIHGAGTVRQSRDTSAFWATVRKTDSSGDEIANVKFYAVRPEGTRIR